MDIDTIREAGKISTQIMSYLVRDIKVGMSALELDKLAGQYCNGFHVKPAFLGVGDKHNPFPGNSCISINHQVLHTIPTDRVIIQPGDIVKVDFGIIYKGFYTDHCVSVGVGEMAEEDMRLIKVAKLAVETAVSKVQGGVKVGDLGHTMQSIVQLAGFDVLKEFVGHGIGRSLHQAPEVPAYGRTGSGDALETGQVICVEAQVVAGNDEVNEEADGWTIVTVDGKKSAMFEYMTLVTENGHEILTDTRNLPLNV